MANPPDDGAGASESPSGAATIPTPRSFHPRRGLPSGRALVGALLITVAAVGAFAVAATGDDGPTTEYLVLVDDVEPGSPIDLSDVRFAAMDLAPEVAANALRTTNGLDGATALRLLRSGEVLDVRALNGAAFIDGEPVVGVHELTFPVQQRRTPADLRRGDRVTVLAHPGDDLLLTALEDALVLAYDTDSPGLINSGEGVLTLALPDSELVTRAALLSYEEDELTVVLTSRAIDDVYAESFQLELTAAAAPPTEAAE